MSGRGDDSFEMDDRRLSDSDAEAILAGRAPAGGDLDGVAQLFATTKAVAQMRPDPALERAHIAAIVEAAHLTAEPAGLTKEPGPSLRTRSKIMLSVLFASLWAKVGVAAASAVIATGGMAAANVLPAPAQDAVAAVAGRIGVDLPKSDKVKDNNKDKSKHNNRPAKDQHGKSVSDDVHSVKDDDSLEGRDKGDAVSDAASQNRQNEKHSNRPEHAGTTHDDDVEAEHSDDVDADKNETEEPDGDNGRGRDAEHADDVEANGPDKDWPR